MTAPFSYSDVTTIKSSVGVYVSYTHGAEVYMDYIRTLSQAYIIHIYTPQRRGVTKYNYDNNTITYEQIQWFLVLTYVHIV